MFKIPSLNLNFHPIPSKISDKEYLFALIKDAYFVDRREVDKYMEFLTTIDYPGWCSEFRKDYERRIDRPGGTPSSWTVNDLYWSLLHTVNWVKQQDPEYSKEQAALKKAKEEEQRAHEKLQKQEELEQRARLMAASELKRKIEEDVRAETKLRYDMEIEAAIERKMDELKRAQVWEEEWRAKLTDAGVRDVELMLLSAKKYR